MPGAHEPDEVREPGKKAENQGEKFAENCELFRFFKLDLPQEKVAHGVYRSF